MKGRALGAEGERKGRIGVEERNSSNRRRKRTGGILEEHRGMCVST